MISCTHDYTAHYRWEYFRRQQWRHTFREWKRHSAGAFAELVRERGLTEQPVLDCSCGLGLKTIILREAGLLVSGSDRCAEAISLAHQFAAEEGNADLPLFISTWAELPRSTEARYAAIFNDALSWIDTEAEMAASLKGLHDALLPGGILTWMGALPGSHDDQRQLLEQEWSQRTANGRHGLGLSAVDGETSVQEVVFLEQGADYIDEHHLYLVHDRNGQRLESWCQRCPVKWSWPKIQPLLETAGFSSFGTQEFTAANGKLFHLVVASRD